MACELGRSVHRVRLEARLGVATTLFLTGCGSASSDDPGRCRQVSSSSDYTAAATDTDGKKWTFDLSSKDVEIRCNSATDTGSIILTGIVRDSLGQAKAGVVVRPFLSGSGDRSKLSINTNSRRTDLNTDSCGVAVFTLTWSCPDTNKEVAGIFYAFSGPLFSNEVKVTVSNLVISNATSAGGTSPTTPTTTATPAK